MERTYTVTVEVRELFADEPVFSETTDIAPDDQRKWETVVTDEGTQFRVEATIEDAVFYDQSGQNRATVAVGTSSSPDVENLIVTGALYFDERTVWVNTTSENGV